LTGILGFQGLGGATEVASVLDRMTDALIHRGPDDRGTWLDPEAEYAVGFRRLSIVDLSPEGHQPMRSGSGRFVLAFNGEVYNHLALRRELDALGHGFRGHSDTEVILAALEQWGIREAVPRFWGMFAMAIWDRRERRLFLVRDRIGKKPLYYGWQGGAFLFGSELKALRCHPAFQGEVDREALALYLRHSCVPGEHSIYRGIHKLRPGCILEVDPGRPGEAGMPEAYWDACAMAEWGQSHLFQGTEAEALDLLEPLLKDAVALRMVADVPVGAFLSGGIDSSLVVALMQAQSPRQVKSFSIGFEEPDYNEAPQARLVAQHLGTDHTEFYVSPAEAMAVIPRLPALFDEPFADSSQIPTFLVSQLARARATVALSGDGGDEVFGGYNRYHVGMRMLGTLGWVPGALRGAMARGIQGIAPAAWDRALRGLDAWLPRRHRGLMTGEKIHKLAGLLTSRGPEDLYLRAVSHWDPETLLAGGPGTATPGMDVAAWNRIKGGAPRMILMDLMTYLPDDILVKVDRASMGTSLEMRAPLLDHRVSEFAWTLPPGMKIQKQVGKVILRRVLDRYVPQALVDRPKRGFGVPIGDWLRGPLRPWAEELLDAGRLQREGFLLPAPIRAKWEEHLSGKQNWQYHLWDILMFQSWLEAQGNA
jgi:asparagine synthase (glutamine-hydrolysing)